VKFIQKYFLVIYFVLLCFALYVLNSCSAENHLAKAIKKDSSIFAPKVDTIILIVPEYIESKKGKDSLIVDNDRVWIKTTSLNDSLFLDYKLKSFIVDTVVKTEIIDNYILDKIVNTKTRQETRLIAKQNRLETKKDSKVKIVAEKQRKKEIESVGTVRRIFRYIKTYLIYILFLLIGFVIGRLTKFLSIKL
jgi:adenylate kinase family enzyme